LLLPVKSFVDAHISVLTLNASHTGNRLNPELLKELLSALEDALKNPDVRVIVIRSSGEVFSHGMDFQRAADTAGGNTIDPRDFENAIELYGKVLSTIHEGPKPVVCVVAGEVKAGGVGLVCCCDVVYATKEAVFELSEVIFGLIPANVLPYLINIRIPLQKARYLILTSKAINSEEAKELNIVDEVFSSDRMAVELKALMKRLLRSSPSALAEVKQFTRDLIGQKMESARSMGRKKLIELITNGDAIKAIQSFQEGSTPEWFEKYRPENPLYDKETP
jgi:enoyl-CoA hydratase/carnithine racemase